MKLALHKSHRSIRTLPPTELPPFTLITGLNGSGKTHLLQAIREGAVTVEGVTKEEVRYFDWTNMAPKDSGSFSVHTLTEERSALWNAFTQSREAHAEMILAAGRQVGLPPKLLNDVTSLANLTLGELNRHFDDPEEVTAIHSKIRQAVAAASQNIRGNRPFKDKQGKKLDLIAASAGREIAALRREDFSQTVAPSWGGSEIFQQQFGRLFVQYMELVKANQLRKCAALVDGDADVQYLTNEEFERHYMVPPWDFVNESLRDAGLDFSINKPDEFDDAPYQPRLTKTSTGAEIAFDDLSSGERILMSLALCLYYAEDRRQLTIYPKLLLLDEVDAPLHPSMSRHFIHAVVETIVGRHQIKVIATTHSPSTVALASEGSLHIMNIERPGVFKTSKAQALNVLTHGVPTLAIAHDGRRQVFVESPRDAAVFGLLYQNLRTLLNSERSLEFIATGARASVSGTDANTGREAVVRIVTALAKSGNQSAFGLIDWDGENSTAGRVHVLAENRRDAIENAILDPLIVAALVLRNPTAASKHKSRLRLPSDASYVKLLSYPAATLQPVVDAIQSAVLHSSDHVPTECVTYHGGRQLQIATAYLRLDGHKLVKNIYAAFPELRVHSTGHELMSYAISTVFGEYPGFVPMDIIESFQQLLNAPTHLEAVYPVQSPDAAA